MANTTTGRPGLAVLSFDGGGVRGYSSLLIVEALMCAIQREMKLETVPRPCEYFNIIGGTSSGGLNAILLGRLGMSAEQALEAYRRVAKLAFTPVPHFPFSPQGAYSGRNLKKAIQDELERHVIGDREAALAEEIRTSGDEASAKAIVAKRAENARDLLYYDPTACRTVVLAKTTTDVGARPTLFKSYATDPRWMSCKIWEIARATSAATTFFPSIKIGRDKIEFLDTALGNNNPCDTLFDEISREFPENNIYCMVSVGTGLQKAIELKNNRLSILRSLAKLATNSNAVHSAMAQRHGSNKPRVYWRFDEDAGLHDVELDNWDAMSKVAGHTSNYINKPEVQNEMNELASCIKVASGEGPNGAS
ncbi:acyl transferase/acyl hydrolase/lysophospholipase [Aspergillus novoparasiticus]|uniref:Acyl transferase/acyl hydrolase/lysophospholipase n=1 Tax=Aspergillus novoparasiticus TaxID=986946 RepID=A0A5N6EJP8_9EURO|nr:acyl transferase/acyl hydrolase/lysophospholipase [Aspergillus novoparasiticus]